MEKNTSECYKRKSKILIVFFIIICAICSVFLIGVSLYVSPLVTTYRVEYIKGQNDIFVQMHYKGEKIYLPDNPSKNGYNFIGWSFDKEEDNWVTPEVVVDKELTLYAKWEEKFYNFEILTADNIEIINISHNNRVGFGECLFFELMLNKSVNNSDIEVVSTSGIVSVEKNNQKYKVTISNVTENFNVCINNIRLNEYNVSINNGDNITNSIVSYGEIVSLPKLEKSGYNFVGYIDNEGNIYTDSLFVCNDINLTAKWEIKKYQITFPKGDGKFIVYYNNEYLINSTTINKDYLSNVEFEVILSKAYSNSNYLVYALSNGQKITPQVLNGKYVFDSIKNDLVIYIENIVINTYNIVIDNIDYGKFSYGSIITIVDNNLVVLDENKNVTKNISPLVEVGFSGWFLSSGEILFNTFIQDIEKSNIVTINGKYSKQIYVITLIANGGYLENSRLIFCEGDDIILPTITKPNYKFAGWYVELIEKNTIVDTQNSIKFDGMLTNNLVLYAGWTI